MAEDIKEKAESGGETAKSKDIDRSSLSLTEVKIQNIGQLTKLYSGKDLLNLKVSEIPMLFDKLIPMVGISMLVGASDTGKSMLLRQMGMSVACGKPFLNHERFVIIEPNKWG